MITYYIVSYIYHRVLATTHQKYLSWVFLNVQHVIQSIQFTCRDMPCLHTNYFVLTTHDARTCHIISFLRIVPVYLQQEVLKWTLSNPDPCVVWHHYVLIHANIPFHQPGPTPEVETTTRMRPLLNSRHYFNTIFIQQIGDEKTEWPRRTDKSRTLKQ